MTDEGRADADATFIVGVPRSGTTLLRTLLDGHPDLFVAPAETFTVDWCGEPDGVDRFFAKTKYDALLAEAPAARARLEAELRRRIPAPTSTPDALASVVAALAAAYGRDGFTRWVEKTPKHHLVVPQLLRAFGPGARVLWVLRDPRATFASQQRRWGKRRVSTFARRWAVAEELVQQLADEPRVRVLRYEDLVTDAPSVMRGVAEHLGLAWHPALLETTRAGEPWKGIAGYEGVSTDSLALFREELPASTCAAIEALLGPRMTRHGYPAGGVAVGLGVVARGPHELRVASAVKRVLAGGQG